jgi:CubicO group peptidase (beta-lactamase class C family)
MRRLLPLAIVLALAVAPPPDDLDVFVQAQMAQHQINGLSLAVIQDGRIEARAYGVTARGGAPVTADTLFQAGSISKPVAATAALKLVELGKLSLDEDVNTKLKTWRIPGNALTQTEKVTLRRLLSHSAGLTVHGFPGYDVKERMPSVVEVLDGAGNTAPVRVDVVPGSLWRYSGGGYTVMQQLVVDVTGSPSRIHDGGARPGHDPQHYQQPLPPISGAHPSGYYADGARCRVARDRKWRPPACGRRQAIWRALRSRSSSRSRANRTRSSHRR